MISKHRPGERRITDILTKIKLTKREKFYVISGGVAVVVFLVVYFVLFPFFDAKAKVKHSIHTSEKTLEEIRTLSAEYNSLKINSENVTKTLSRRTRGFTLFSFLEKEAGRAGIKAHIKYMKPSVATNDDGQYKESSVEMKMAGINMKQLVDYLHFVESSKDLVKIKRISIKKDKADKNFLTVLMQVVTYQ